MPLWVNAEISQILNVKGHVLPQRLKRRTLVLVISCKFLYHSKLEVKHELLGFRV